MTEQQRYDVLGEFPRFELRRYAAHLVAEVEVEGSFADAGNRAFGVLVAFISGRNSAGRQLAMTAPVVQERASARIPMTAPVMQGDGSRADRHVVGFVMPSGFTLDTLPSPTDARVTVREVPSEVAAAVAFSGRWSERLCREHLETLRSAVAGTGLDAAGAPRFARFDPPWTPWFLRRNEVVLPVSSASAAGLMR